MPPASILQYNWEDVTQTPHPPPLPLPSPRPPSTVHPPYHTKYTVKHLSWISNQNFHTSHFSPCRLSGNIWLRLSGTYYWIFRNILRSVSGSLGTCLFSILGTFSWIANRVAPKMFLSTIFEKFRITFFYQYRVRKIQTFAVAKFQKLRNKFCSHSNITRMYCYCFTAFYCYTKFFFWRLRQYPLLGIHYWYGLWDNNWLVDILSSILQGCGSGSGEIQIQIHEKSSWNQILDQDNFLKMKI